MPDDESLFLTIKQYPATVDGRYPDIAGFALAYNRTVFWCSLFEALEEDHDYSVSHGVTLRIYMQRRLKCVRVCRIDGETYVPLGPGFTFAWIYVTGESRDPTGEITNNHVQEYLQNYVESGDQTMNSEGGKLTGGAGNDSQGDCEDETVVAAAKTGLPRAVEILIAKLGDDGVGAQKAAVSLADQARRRGAKLNGAVKLLIPYLQDKQLGVRAGIAETLGYIGTKPAVNAIVKAFEGASDREHCEQISRDGFTDQSLAQRFADSLSNRETKLSAIAMVTLLGSDSLPDFAKAAVMSQLAYFDLDELGISIPDGIVEVMGQFASSDDEEIAEGAIRLLGKI
jgi:hypothetical protein